MAEPFRVVSKGIKKKDAKALVTGRPVFTDDLAPAECLIVKALRSPHASAVIEEIDTKAAMLVPGIECVLTWKDVPRNRFTNAGQSYPEPSPYDRCILENRVRYVGDEVALVAGDTEAAVNKALRLIKVKYRVEEPVLDLMTALDYPVLVHPEEDWKQLCPVGGDPARNLCAVDGFTVGDIDAELAACDVVVEGTYHTQACSQGMMEAFATYTEMDTYGRLKIVSSTQIPFHVRRIVATALGIPKTKIRVVKPRVGGGFGAKQTACTEVLTAVVTWLTGKPAKMVYTRHEVMAASNSRHEMVLKLRMGAMKDGTMRGIDMRVISNTGAYGEHGPTVCGLAGHKALTMYGPLPAYRFHADVVYTNTMTAAAYRGYGATQGIFAVESLADDLAEKLHMDPIEFRLKNMVHEGAVLTSYYNEPMLSCAMDRCMLRARELSGWREKGRVRAMGEGRVRAMGVSMSLQGSGIGGLDQGSVEIRLNSEGFYSLMMGSADMGTGSDTTLCQIAAECLGCDIDLVVPYGVDTDTAPYDTGSYASSTAFVTGGAVVKTCGSLLAKMKAAAAGLMDCAADRTEFDGAVFTNGENDNSLTLTELAVQSHCGSVETLTASETNMQPYSPPPVMVGIAEVEIDMATGQVMPVEYVGVVDCGTPLNERIVRVQTEGGIVQGIGMALYEHVCYDAKGAMKNNSFMQYKIPSRLDMGNITVEIESSYEPNGPFGAKSIGEVVINTPCPAIANAVYAATGVRITELPITAEKVYMGMVANGRIRK